MRNVFDVCLPGGQRFSVNAPQISYLTLNPAEMQIIYKTGQSNRVGAGAELNELDSIYEEVMQHLPNHKDITLPSGQRLCVNAKDIVYHILGLFPTSEDTRCLGPGIQIVFNSGHTCTLHIAEDLFRNEIYDIILEALIEDGRTQD